MDTESSGNLSWEEIISEVMELPPHKDLRISKQIESPLRYGFRRGLGEIRGQIADYRLCLEGRSIHVVEYAREYLVHWDHADPELDPLGHLLRDSPHWIPRILGMAIGVISGLVSYALTRRPLISLGIGISAGGMGFLISRKLLHLTMLR